MIKRIFTALLILGSTTLFAQPANDDCGGIVDLGEAPICPVIDTFTNVDATLSSVFSDPSANIPLCFEGGTIDRDVWFQFSVPPSGDIIDFTISAIGVDGPNGSILQPQIAVYRGDCGLDELQELFCATSVAGSSEVSFDLLGLTPGLTYFLRVADWSASASPNWGDFELCVDEYDPVFNIGDVPSSESCAGTLFDSGGPTGDYGDGENFTFTICPSDFHQCIFINVDNFNIENTFDNLTFYAGADVTAPQITNLTGAGGGVEIQAASNCVTIQFTSDGSFSEEGFELTWMCSPDTCSISPSTCDAPTAIASLPYVATDLTTCNAWNSVTTSPCNNNFWLAGDDYIFTYTSPGDECISVAVTGASFGTGVGVFDDCPNVATDCLGQAGGDFGGADPIIPAVFLEEPGTYYIVVDNNTACTPFDIDIQSVDCPVVFPSAALCDDALSMNGCNAQNQSTIINVAPGDGDPTFVVDGVNAGCWTAAASPANHTWFFFQAQNDGNFGFTLNAANPAEASDIDFNVWGPIIDPLDICGYAAINEPIRSSWAGGADPTGLADIHPVLGTPVVDVCEDAGGDDFVSTIPVLENEYYVVLVNDWGGAIQSGAITLSFSGTTPGVLEPLAEFSVSADTVLCPGEDVQLLAEGGDVYQWSPPDGLSCINCPDPIANPSLTTTYTVRIFTLCQADSFDIQVGRLDVDAGPDQTVCVGEEIQIFASDLLGSADYNWVVPSGVSFSCTDCPSPVVTAIDPGTYTLEVTGSVTACSVTDDMVLEVLTGIAPDYEISEDQQLCLGEDIDLGGNPTPGVDYSWTSNPPGFMSGSPNPNVTPTETTTYYLEVFGGDCPIPSFDSVHVEVSEIPIVDLIQDTKICIGESISLGSTISESDVIYTWTPTDGLDSANVANPTATPTQTTQYNFTAERNGCIVSGSILVEVVQLSLTVPTPDTIGLCRGESVDLMASATPAGTSINWLPDNGSLNMTTGPLVTATPLVPTTYTAQIEVDGCVIIDSTWVGVDSVPWDLTIMPIDTQVCVGELVTLTSPTYEPADFDDITFIWFGEGQITPDSLFNMVVQPPDTIEYSRITTNGFCSDTSTVTVNVIDVANIMIEPAQSIICPGESIQLNVISDVTLEEFEWSPTGSLSCTDCLNPTASPNASTNYSLEAEYEGCPVGASATVVVSPQLLNLSDIDFCPGDPVTLNNVNVPNDVVYNWTTSGGTFVSDEANPVVFPTSTTTYNVTATFGDCTEEGSVTVTTAGPFSVMIQSLEVQCPGIAFSILAEIEPSGPTLEWFNEDTGASLGSDNPLDLNLSENMTITAQATNACGEMESDTYIIQVSPEFSLTASANPSVDVPAGSDVTLTATVAGGVGLSYSWSDDDGEFSTDAVTVVTPCSSMNYTVVVTDENGCTREAMTSVDVIAGFTIDSLGLALEDTVYTYLTTGDTVDLPTIYEGQEFQIIAWSVPQPVSGATYNWQYDGSVFSSNMDTLSGVFNANEVDMDTEFPYGLSIIDPAGCSDSLFLDLLVLNNPVVIPNVFTPNNDGTNDIFNPTSKIPITISEFKVWNRWGQLVYDNENEGVGWEGLQDEEPAASDVYVYRITWEITGGNGMRIVEKGDVTLIR